jgi:hypothetical protein
LVVNNTADVVRGTCRIGIDGLPDRAIESLSGVSVDVKDGVIEHSMPPFGVCAYVLERD